MPRRSGGSSASSRNSGASGRGRSVRGREGGPGRGGDRPKGGSDRPVRGRGRRGPRPVVGNSRGRRTEEEDAPAVETRPMDPMFYILVFLGILFIFAGLDLMIMLSKLSRFWGLPVLAIGAGLLVFVEYRYGTLRALPLVMKADVDDLERAGPDSLLEQKGYDSAPVIYWTTLKEKLIPFLWVLGAAMIAGDLAYNLVAGTVVHNSLSGRFGSFDITVVLLAVAFIGYRFVPVKFSRERDFILVLFIFIFLILILPATISSYLDPQSAGITDSPLVKTFLTTPMLGLLKVLGLEVSARGNEITYPLQAGGTARVGIALSCAGIYSQTLFISGFISYILVEYRKWDIKASLLLVAGVLTAWIANILRMTIIVIIGSYRGEDAFLWAHKYLGTVIFFVWIFIFWGIIFLVLKATAGKKEEEPSS